MEVLFRPDGKIDVKTFEKAVFSLFRGTNVDEINRAKQILFQFSVYPDAWLHVTDIVEQAELPESKMVAFRALESLITTRWKALPEVQAKGIKAFVIGNILKMANNPPVAATHANLLTTLDKLLVQIVKAEWPASWPNFIQEVVNSSKTNASTCENNMTILKMLSEDIFEFSQVDMTQAKRKQLMLQFTNETSLVFNFCMEVLSQAEVPSLLNATLETLQRFLAWLPVEYIFQSNLLQLLCTRFLSSHVFRNASLQCLIKIASAEIPPVYDEKLVHMFNSVVEVSAQIFGQVTDFKRLLINTPSASSVVGSLALFFVTFLTNQIRAVDIPPNMEMTLRGHQVLLRISEVEDHEIFKCCVDYWGKLVVDIFGREKVSAFFSTVSANSAEASAGSGGNSLIGRHDRRIIYKEVLSSLRVVMIDKMVRPEEVLVVENDDGEIVTEKQKETDVTALYKSMREILIFLTNLDPKDMERIMQDSLLKQVSGPNSQWDPNRPNKEKWGELNRLCWAIGSISGSMNEDSEKVFLVNVIKDLLALVDMKKGKDNKAVVASNIMYVVGQYPRFLRDHWTFLKTVVKKLFEFMHESHEGVQDMACDTFLKIANKCRQQFVVPQRQDAPFVDEILNSIESIISDLQPAQIPLVFEGVAMMIQSAKDKGVQNKWLRKLMEFPNQNWDNIISACSLQVDETLRDSKTTRSLNSLFKINLAVCGALGHPYLWQMGRLFMNILALYKAVSAVLNKVAQANPNPNIVSHSEVRGLRSIKVQSLKLIGLYITKAEEPQMIVNSLLPSLLEVTLSDYTTSFPPLREYEVLTVFGTFVEKYGELVAVHVPGMINALLDSTLSMITTNFVDNSDYRLPFYRLIYQIVSKCFPPLLALPPPVFTTFINAILWGIKHPVREVADVALNALNDLINRFAREQDPTVVNTFFSAYLIRFVEEVFVVLTDTEHKQSFKMQCQVIALILQVVDSDRITVPLYDPSTFPQQGVSNAVYLKEHIRGRLQAGFPQLQPPHVHSFLEFLFSNKNDMGRLRRHLLDFLIALQSFAGDTDSLFLDDKEAEAEQQKLLMRETAKNVPGLLRMDDLGDGND